MVCPSIRRKCLAHYPIGQHRQLAVAQTVPSPIRIANVTWMILHRSVNNDDIAPHSPVSNWRNWRRHSREPIIRTYSPGKHYIAVFLVMENLISAGCLIKLSQLGRCYSEKFPHHFCLKWLFVTWHIIHRHTSCKNSRLIVIDVLSLSLCLEFRSVNVWHKWNIIRIVYIILRCMPSLYTLHTHTHMHRWRCRRQRRLWVKW